MRRRRAVSPPERWTQTPRMPVDTALLEALLAPVPGDNPAGRDLRYDPRYDQVKEARREDLELPPGGLATDRKVADWPQVVKLSGQLLSAETKDLQLAAWLSEALLKRDGLSGLVTGLESLRSLLAGDWGPSDPPGVEGGPALRGGPRRTGAQGRRAGQHDEGESGCGGEAHDAPDCIRPGHRGVRLGCHEDATSRRSGPCSAP
jgi:hypothetical protein